MGLGAVANGLALVALAGRFTPPVLAAAAACGAAAIAVALRRRRAGSAGRRDAAGSGAVPLAAGALAALGPLLLALYPPYAWDATIYHLPLARRLVESRGFDLADNLRVPAFPLLAESLFGAGLASAGPLAAQMVSVAAALATAALLLAWGRERLGPGPLAALPAALWLGHPIVVYYAGTAYVEPLLALFVTAAFFAYDRWRRDGELRWLGLAGAAAGWAAATKYLGLPIVLLLVLASLVHAPRGRRLRSALACAAGAICAAAPWYLWIWLSTGNPVFPFLSGIFGASAWNATDVAAMDRMDRGLATRAATWLTVSWDVVLDRARLNQQPPFSPWALLALPAGVWAALRAAWLRPPLAALALAVLGLGWLPRDARYLLGPAPALGLALAVAAADLVERFGPAGPAARRRLAAALAALALATGPAYAGYRLAKLGPPPAGQAATDAFLRRELPGYGAIERLNRIAGPGATLYGFRSERTLFWFAGRQVGEWSGPYRFSTVGPLLEDPERLWVRLRGYGVDFLLVPRAPGTPGAALPSLPGFARRFRTVLEDAEARVFALRP